MDSLNIGSSKVVPLPSCSSIDSSKETNKETKDKNRRGTNEVNKELVTNKYINNYLLKLKQQNDHVQPTTASPQRVKDEPFTYKPNDNNSLLSEQQDDHIKPTTTSTPQPIECNTSYIQPFTKEKSLTFHFNDNELPYYLQGYNLIRETTTSKYNHCSIL
jgi:hypothetical protein